MTNDTPRRGPGRPRKTESQLDKVAELATDLGLGIKQSIEVAVAQSAVRLDDRSVFQTDCRIE